MKIAIIGTGISGLTAAYLLHRGHEITVYEANDYIGGHTHTIPVRMGDREYAIDTGFIVFNHENYPNFTKLLTQLGASWQPSNMSFSVRCDRSGLEYCGSSLNQMFAQRRNLLNPGFYRMLWEIRRFRDESREVLSDGHPLSTSTLQEYLSERRYSQRFIDHFVVPMGSAIWSANPGTMLSIPARFFVQFFANHRFLELGTQPQWYTVEGGSWRYVDPLTRSFRDRIRLSTPVRSIRRAATGVIVEVKGTPPTRYDEVIIATHSDQALRLLADPSDQERRVLGAIGYQENEAVLHTDESLLPRCTRAWASWNYQIASTASDRVAVTYNMNKLQSIDSDTTFCVTLNNTEAIDPKKVILRQIYHHPVFTLDSIAAQGEHASISGANHTHFCGAYWGYGFHEDGVDSALAVCQQFGLSLQSQDTTPPSCESEAIVAA